MKDRGKSNKTTDFLPDQGLVIFVGNYGSGKTEVCVNLAIRMASKGFSVQIADLDIVNPYFRCREAREHMEQYNIRVVVPPGSLSFSGLPVVVPEIQGMLNPAAEGYRLFDVGGDEVGARLLSSMARNLDDTRYSLWQVINARRPFSDSVGGCVKMMEAIERTSRLSVTGLVANTHLVTETTAGVIIEGWRQARQVAERTGRELMFVTAMGELADAAELAEVDAPILRLERQMLPPWTRRPRRTRRTRKKKINATDLPSARPVPIGRPSEG